MVYKDQQHSILNAFSPPPQPHPHIWHKETGKGFDVTPELSRLVAIPITPGPDLQRAAEEGEVHQIANLSEWAVEGFLQAAREN